MMSWFYLLIAGLFECAWAVGMKYTDGFTKLMPTLLTVSAMGISVWLLSLSMKSIPVGTAYVVWAGIGAVGVTVAGMLVLGESKDFIRIFFVFIIVSGVLGLKFVSN